MAKIDLSNTHTEQIELSEKPIIINEDKKEYQTTRGIILYGDIFIAVYNELIDSIHETGAIPSYVFDYFQGINLSEIADYMKNGTLSTSMKEKIKTNTKTLAFRVGVYKNKPTLYYIGYEDYLFIYDMLMIKQHNIRVKFCEDCGKAFIPNTKGLYCPHCRDIVKRNRVKYQALKNDPVRLMFTRLQQRIQKRERNSPYRTLFENLVTNHKEIEWLTKWSELDKQYQKIKRYCMEYDSTITEKSWNDSLSAVKISSIDNFEQWLIKQKENNSII